MHTIATITASSIFVILGTIHLVYTFYTKKFDPRNKDVIGVMNSTSLMISKDLNMWKTWIGFNASHSLGMMYFGLINIILAILFHAKENPVDLLISILNIAFSLSFLILAKRYWFKIPLIGAFCATVLFILAALM